MIFGQECKYKASRTSFGSIFLSLSS